MKNLCNPKKCITFVLQYNNPLYSYNMENKTLAQIVDEMVADIKAMTATIEERSRREQTFFADIEDYLASQAENVYE